MQLSIYRCDRCGADCSAYEKGMKIVDEEVCDAD